MAASLYWIVDYPYKRSSLWRDNQEKDTELPCPRWLRWSPERQRRITPILCSRTNEDWFLAATVQFPSSAPIPPSSPAVTSAPLHVLSCLCRDGKGIHCVPLEPAVCWSASWPLPTLTLLVSMQPTTSWLHGGALSGRPGICKSLISFYQIWLELINELEISVSFSNNTPETACGNFTFFIKVKGGGGNNTLCTTLIKSQAFGS